MGLSYLIKLNTRGTKKWRVFVPERLSGLSSGGAMFENFYVLSRKDLTRGITTQYC
jgi:hypothetical protein